MSTPTVAPEIAAFAARVRAALADLPAEEVDDLTEGLEADLSESLAEDLRRTLPDPVAYAAELRAAAGLPMPSGVTKRGVLAGLEEGWRDTLADLAVVARRNPVLVGLWGFLGELRPAWWIVRAWLAAWLSAAFFGMERGYWFEGVWWIVLVAFVVVSVQWGRGRWGFAGLPALVTLGNVVAAVALLPVLDAGQAWSAGSDVYEAGANEGSAAVDQGAPADGLAFDGHVLENIYAYDAKGRALHGVQLFDVDGTPLTTSRDGFANAMSPKPVRLETGTSVYNVFPLDLVKLTDDGNGGLVPDPSPDPDKRKAYENGPFLKVPALQATGKVAKTNH